MTVVEEAEQAGFGISLIDEALRCSYEDCVVQHQAALKLALEQAGQTLHKRSPAVSGDMHD